MLSQREEIKPFCSTC